MKNRIADQASIGDRGTAGADAPAMRRTRARWAAHWTDSGHVPTGQIAPPEESDQGRRSTPYRMRLRFVTIVTTTFGMLGLASPAVACETVADDQYWSDNCLTDWTHYRVSDLTSGVQNIMHYDGHPGYTSSIDGVYGTSGGGGATPAAVKSFQTWAGLGDDGKAGSFTWNALDASFHGAGTTDNYLYYRIGSNYDRMVVSKSNHQAYVRKPNDYWVRVDAWRSTGTTTWPS